MKKALITVATLLCASQAHALHWFNCSSANDELKIVEHEIWGANPVSCTANGGKDKLSKVVLVKGSEVEIRKVKTGPTDRDFSRDYYVMAKMKASGKVRGRPSGEEITIPLICHEQSDNAMDLAAPIEPCTVVSE